MAFRELPHLSEGAHLQIATSGTVSERVLLTWEPDLSKEVIEVLLRDPEREVVGGLVQNEALDTKQIQRLVTAWPEFRGLAAQNVNAPLSLVGGLGVWEVQGRPLTSFFERMNATVPGVRLFEAIVRMSRPPGPSLASTWDAVREIIKSTNPA